MHFGENQLSPRSFGISPLSTGHPSLLQQTPVRPSTRSYPRFSLPMDSSRGFGSIPCDSKRPVQTRFRCGSGYHSLSLATQNHSPVRSTKSTPSPLAWLRLVVGAGFQDLFHPPLPGCFSPFPHGTVHYRFVRVTSLGGWSPLLPAGCRVSRRTHGTLAQSSHFRLRGSHPLWRPVPAAFG